jgi:GTP-binding protein LepA
MAAGKRFDRDGVGAFCPRLLEPKESLSAGEVGYIAAIDQERADTRVGDTITWRRRPVAEPLPGYKR